MNSAAFEVVPASSEADVTRLKVSCCPFFAAMPSLQLPLSGHSAVQRLISSVQSPTILPGLWLNTCASLHP